MPKDIAIVIHW